MRLGLALLPLCLLAAAHAQAGEWANLWRTPAQQGQHLLDTGRADEAARTFKDPRRRAYAELEAGHYADAAKLLAPYKDPNSEYNRGNALARAGKLEAALAAYDAGLAAAPDDHDLRHNRDLVARALEKQKKQKPSSQSSSHGGRQAQKAGGGAKRAGQNRGHSGETGTQAGQSGAQGPNADRHANTGANRKPAGGDSKASAPNGRTAASSRKETAAGHKPGDDARQAERDAKAAVALNRQAGKKPADGTPSEAADLGTADQLGSRQPERKPAQKPESEQALALDQWLRRIPDDPAGLLRRKFLIEHALRQQQRNAQ